MLNRKVITIFVLIAIFLFHSYAFSNSSNDRYFHALRLRGDEKFAEAINELQQLIHDDPQFIRAYKSLSEIYTFQNSLEAGRNYFSRLIEQNSANAYGYYGLARIELFAKNNSAARTLLEKSMKLDPNCYYVAGSIAQIYIDQKDKETGVKYFNQMLTITPDRPAIYYGIGEIYKWLLDWKPALEAYQRAIELDSNTPLPLMALTTIYRSAGQYKKVLEIDQNILDLGNKQNDLESIAFAYMGMSYVNFYYGDYWKALQFYSKSINLSKSLGDLRTQAIQLNNIASVYAMLLDRTKALEYFNQSLEISRRISNQTNEIRVLLNMGNIYKELNQFERAMSNYQQALRLCEKIKSMDLSLIFGNMADAYLMQQQYEQGIIYAQKALESARDIDDKEQEGYALRTFGNLMIGLQKYEDAIRYHQLALAIGKEIKDIQIMWESYAGLGACYEQLQENQSAIIGYKKAIALYDSVRMNLDLASLGTSFLEDKFEAYPSIIQLLAHDGNFAEAFSYAEKYKAKLLTNIVAQGQAHIEQTVPDSVRQQLTKLSTQIEDLHRKLLAERNCVAPNQKVIVDLDQQVTDCEVKKSLFLEELKKKYGAFYQLTSGDPLSIQEVQSSVLGSDQTLIEYIVGQKKISAFIAMKDTLLYLELPVTRDSLEQMLKNLSPIFDRQQKNYRPIFNAQLANFSILPSYQLYQALIKPLESFFQINHELIIVPDDLLYYLPFETLVCDISGVESHYDFSHARFLIEKYVVSYSPSASLLDPRLQHSQPLAKGVLAFGDPNFKVFTENRSLNDTTQHVIDGIRGEYLTDLPNSKLEVKSISRALSGIDNKIYIGRDASEKNFRTQVGNFHILHFATHFFTNDNQPLYSKLILTRSKNDNDDGYLHTYEIFNLKLNADLAVLSACNTGLGQLSKGEGLIGVSRAFLYAGVPSLIVSLWSVDDKTTAIIMKNFYTYLRQGKTKKQALNLARIDYLHQAANDKRDPFYWAPFVLIGDWQTIVLPTRSYFSFLSLALGGSILGITIFICFKRQVKKKSQV
jgi:CHAT domain-containing protein/lipopolysaccharide biosynthesis regulator YciM